MRVTYIVGGISLLFASPIWAQDSHGPAAHQRPAITRDQIQALIRKLGADENAVREKATEELKKLGGIVAEPLREAFKDPDAEIRARARHVFADVTRTLTCEEMALLIAQELRKQPLVDEMRDHFDAIRKAIAAEYAAANHGHPLEQFQDDFWKKWFENTATKGELIEEVPNAQYHEKLDQIIKEMREKGFDKLLDKTLSSPALANKGIVFKRSSLSGKEKLTAPADRPVADYTARVNRDYVAELEINEKRMLLSYTPPISLKLHSIADKATNHALKLKDELKGLAHFESAGNGVTKALLTPAGIPLLMPLPQYHEAVVLEYDPSRAANAYQLTHGDPKDAALYDGKVPFRNAYVGKLPGICSYLAETFKKECPALSYAESRDIPAQRSLQPKFSEALLVPFRGERLDLERINFNRFFWRKSENYGPNF